MYKNIRIKSYTIAFEKFSRKRKDLSVVYKTGFRNWDAMDSKDYSIVLGFFRIIISVNKNIGACQC